jgi:hypothetical protein
MSVFIDRIDAAPLDDDDFSFSFNSWVSNTVDVLNEDLADIQNQFNGISDGLVVPQKTTIQITALALTAPNGTLWYDITTNQLKALVNGVVTVIS